MKRATVLLFAVLFVPATHADAKFSSARICGPSDCREVDLTAKRKLLPILQAAFPQATGPRGSRPTSNPPAASPWYRVTLCPGVCESPHAPTLKVLPTSGYQYIPVPSTDESRKGWAKLDETAADAYRRVTTGLEPFPASHLVALGAVEPSSELGGGSEGGMSAWMWVAIAAAAAAFALLSLRKLQRSRRARTAP